MKNIIQTALFLTIICFSCGGDEISYPAIYDFDRDVELGTSIITEDTNGNLIEVPNIQSFGVTLCDIFDSIHGDQGISTITLLSASEMELVILDDAGNTTEIIVPYTMQDDIILESFGLSINEDQNIVSKICNKLTFAPNKNIALAESNYCSSPNTINEQVVSDFISNGYEQGDTLGLCVINKIYKPR